MTNDQIIQLRSPTLREPPTISNGISLKEESDSQPSTYPSYSLSVSVDLNDADDDELLRALWYALGKVFARSGVEGNLTIGIKLVPNPITDVKLLQALQDLSSNRTPSGHFTFTRSWWYQSYNLYAYNNSVKKAKTEQLVTTEESSVPQRPAQSTLPSAPHPLYERYIPHLDSYFCLSIFGNSDADIDLLHTWLNDPRVDQFWKDAGTRDEHVNFLKVRYDAPHIIPVLGSYRGTAGDKSVYEPFAYYEIYWAAEDKIGKFYPAKPYDRGIHMLVGSSDHRGPHRVKSWLPSLAHYIFNDEARTERIISEPDRRNSKMINYLESFGFKKSAEVDVGHKVAALMILDRDDFWAKCPL